MKALLIDARWCYGCHGCELACQTEHGMKVGENGIVVTQIGVWPYEDKGGAEKWQHSYLPVPTDQCDACAARTSEGELPTCVKHCFANCLRFGEVEELAKGLTDAKQCLYVIEK
ncbi:oxidoreductase [Gordonibacter sp. 28C]|uniref:oxidoreductase n=1 Tax=Gordonibacter sp. 28C TaxID=2078569 RepID=UPI000DF77775|nr:oxidoreductase [Gordonibacter sp. 28C]RDB63883.1 oxidoreductase [Gordonibacter sp. 28C]